MFKVILFLLLAAGLNAQATGSTRWQLDKNIETEYNSLRKTLENFFNFINLIRKINESKNPYKYHIESDYQKFDKLKDGFQNIYKRFAPLNYLAGFTDRSGYNMTDIIIDNPEDSILEIQDDKLILDERKFNELLNDLNRNLIDAPIDIDKQYYQLAKKAKDLIQSINDLLNFYSPESRFQHVLE